MNPELRNTRHWPKGATIEVELREVIQSFNASETRRTCRQCGSVLPVPAGARWLAFSADRPASRKISEDASRHRPSGPAPGDYAPTSVYLTSQR